MDLKHLTSLYVNIGSFIQKNIEKPRLKPNTTKIIQLNIKFRSAGEFNLFSQKYIKNNLIKLSLINSIQVIDIITLR